MGLEGVTGKKPDDYEHDLAVSSRSDSSLRWPVFMGVAAAVISLGGLICWSYVVTISSAVIVPGTVVVNSGRKYIQHISGGTIKSIDVYDGEAVKAGQVLICLDTAALDIAYGSLERLYAMNIAAQIRLRAEQDNLSFVVFPQQVTDVDRVTWMEAKRDQGKLFQTRRASLTARNDTLKSDGEEAALVVKSIDEQVEAQRVRINLTEQELATARSLAQSGYDTRHHVLEISRSLAEYEIELVSLHSRELDARQNTEHDRLEALQSDASFSENAATDLQQVQREYADLSLKMKSVGQQLAALKIRAPVSGRVVNLAVHTLGGVIGAGATILELVPENDPLVLEADVRPDDIDNVTVGLPVDIRLAGFNGQKLPRLRGTVTRVSADRLEDPVRGTAFFRIRAEVGQEGLAEIGIHELKAGMVVTLMIEKGQQTPIEYLVSPLVMFFTRALKS